MGRFPVVISMSIFSIFTVSAMVNVRLFNIATFSLQNIILVVAMEAVEV